jgi:hypothetical protein
MNPTTSDVLDIIKNGFESVEKVKDLEAKLSNAEEKLSNAEVKLSNAEEKLSNAEVKLYVAETRLAVVEAANYDYQKQLEAIRFVVGIPAKFVLTNVDSEKKRKEPPSEIHDLERSEMYDYCEKKGNELKTRTGFCRYVISHIGSTQTGSTQTQSHGDDELCGELNCNKHKWRYMRHGYCNYIYTVDNKRMMCSAETEFNFCYEHFNVLQKKKRVE